MTEKPNSLLITIDIVFKLIVISVLVFLLVQRQQAGKMPETSPFQALPQPSAPNVTQTASPTITVHNGDSGWSKDVPHTVNDAASFLNRTPDTIRTYIPRWIEDGAGIEKTQGGMWILPPGFEPYIPE
jgi:hypothetical protein